MPKKNVSLDFAFFAQLRRFYFENKGMVRSYYRQLTRIILDYNDPANKRPGQFLRQPQFEALEMYVFLKEFLSLKPVHEIFTDWYKKENGFERRGDVAGMGGMLALSEDLTFDEKAYKKLFKRMEKTAQLYPNYIFALTMGVGKTLLMATCIFYEFTLARKHPKDPKYCHNALIFAPDKTVLQSLREIETFDFSKVLPPKHANWLHANLRMQYLDEAGTALSTMDDSKFNLIVSNAQKIILKRKKTPPTPSEMLWKSGEHRSSVFDDYADIYGDDRPQDEQDLTINQRFLKLRRLPQLGIYVDEAHHAFGNKLVKAIHDNKSDTSLRRTISTLAKSLERAGTHMVGCFNFTGTPYVKNEVLPEVVYAYGLDAAIRAGYLKTIKLHGYSNPRNKDFIRAVISNFLEEYGERRVGNMLPKLAFFAPDIEDANDNLRPIVEEILAEHGVSTDAILVNVGDKKITTNDDLREFNKLDTERSEKQFIILVNKGKEGWNCKSLCGVAMFRRPRSKIFVLQASMRCLRAIGNEELEGQVYLSDENVQILENELQQNFRLTTKDLGKTSREKINYEVRVLKQKKIKLTNVRHVYECQTKELTEKAKFNMDEWDVERYKFEHTIQDAVLEKGGLSKEKTKEDLTALKERRTWTAYTLTAEISRYLNVSPLKIEKLLKESEEGLAALVGKVNEHNELLYDEVIPALFDLMFHVTSYKKEEIKEVELVKIPKDGFYQISGDPDKTELFNNWSSKPEADKSFHLDTYCFDSMPEKEFFTSMIDLAKVNEIYFTGMLTHGQSDFAVNYIDPYTHTVRSYYPDFLLHLKDGEWLVVEVKAANQMDDIVVQAKKDFAEQMLSASNIRYEMVAHNRVAGCGRLF